MILGIILEEGTALGVGISLIILTFILNIVSILSDKAEFVKYFTPYFYLDISPAIRDEEINSGYLILIMFVSLIIILAGSRIFKSKDIDI